MGSGSIRRRDQFSVLDTLSPQVFEAIRYSPHMQSSSPSPLHISSSTETKETEFLLQNLICQSISLLHLASEIGKQRNVQQSPSKTISHNQKTDIREWLDPALIKLFLFQIISQFKNMQTDAMLVNAWIYVQTNQTFEKHGSAFSSQNQSSHNCTNIFPICPTKKLKRISLKINTFLLEFFFFTLSNFHSNFTWN